MISKAKACPGGTALFNYVVNDKKGYELLRNNLSGITPKELYSDMTIFQQQNLRCTNNTISIVLSPTVADGTKMSTEQLKTLSEDLLKEMGLDPKSNQFIAFVHTEKDHKHIHILMNRVQMDGTLIDDSHISKKAQRAAHKVALEHGWTSAKDILEAKELKREYSNLHVKKEIKEAHFKALTTRPNSLHSYQKEMSKLGVIVLPTINKQGHIQGFRFIHESTGTNLKASEVDRNLKLNELFSNENSIKLTPQADILPLHEWKLNHAVLETFSAIINSNITPEYEQDENIKKKRRGIKR